MGWVEEGGEGGRGKWSCDGSADKLADRQSDRPIVRYYEQDVEIIGEKAGKRHRKKVA